MNLCVAVKVTNLKIRHYILCSWHLQEIEHLLGELVALLDV